MDRKNILYILIKSFFFLIIFTILHFLYDIFPNIFFAVISGTSESIFQHAKMSFYSYIILSAIEYFYFKEKKSTFFYSRMLIASLSPWLMFLLWYFLAAVYGPLHLAYLEIAYTLLITFALGFCLSVLDNETDHIIFKNKTKIVITILFLLFLLYSVIFSFKMPWADFFAIPINNYQ